ncbi:MAG: tetratricopeptide repeat protein [Armatimonadia bacterium]
MQFRLCLISACLVVAAGVAWSQDTLADSYAAGQKLFGEGRYAEAQTAFDRCLVANPAHYQSWAYLAKCLEKQGKTAESCYAYEQVVRYGPTQSAEAKDAKVRLTQLSRQFPRPWTVYVPRGQAGDFEKMLEADKAGDWVKLAYIAEQIIADKDRYGDKWMHADFYLGKAQSNLRNWTGAKQSLNSYLAADPQGEFVQAAQDLLAKVDQSVFDETVIGIERALLNHNTVEADRLMAVAAQLPRQTGNADLVYLDALSYAYKDDDEKAKAAFERYTKEAPQGRFVMNARSWLAYLQQPILLTIEDGTLCRSRMDGSSRRELSDKANQGEVTDGLASPDGRMIAYSTSADNGFRHNLYLASADGSVKKSLHDAKGSASDVGFDKLAWTQYSGAWFLSFVAPDASGDYAIYVYDSRRNQVPEDRAVIVPRSTVPRAERNRLRPFWSPSGDWLAWIAADGTLYAAPTSSLDNTIQVKAKSSIRAVAWMAEQSADQPLVLIYHDGNNLYRLDVNAEFRGGKVAPRTLYSSKSPIRTDALGVSSDGAWVGLQLQEGRGPRFLLVRIDGKLSSKTLEGVSDWSFSPRGGQLVLKTNRGLGMYPLSDVGDLRLIPGTSSKSSFTWAPIGDHLLWWEDQEAVLCYDRQRIIGDKINVPGSFSRPAWTPDAKAIALQRDVDGRGSIWIMSYQPKSSELTLKPLIDDPARNCRLLGWGL